MAENPDSAKHQTMRQILENLGIEVLPGHFSEGSTVTLEALEAILAALREKEEIINDIQRKAQAVVDDFETRL